MVASVQLRQVGPYEIERRLATGGMAEVYVARRRGPHGFVKRVALKRILPQFSKDPDFVAMFIDEARLAASLDHPNVVQTFDFGETDDQLYLAMELVEGTNVNRLLRAVAARDETVPLHDALYIASRAAHALAHAHGARDDQGNDLGIVHRDVSPANLLITRDGYVKLTDFGIARGAQNEAHTDQGHVRGKLGYMSPEQVTGKPLDGRSDVFTLTVVLAEMLLGEPLFGHGNDLDVLLRIRDVDLATLERTERRIPGDVQKLLRMGLERETGNRPTAQAFAAATDEVVRRRGYAHTAERLAHLCRRLELVSPGDLEDPDPAEAAPTPPGPPTALIEAGGVGTESARLLGELELSSPDVYRVRTAAGKVLGPMPFPRLVELLTRGVIDGDTPVAKAEGAWAAARALPELTRFVTSPALQWTGRELEGASRGGQLGAMPLLSVVHRILIGEETGVLHLRDGVRRKKLYFVEGRPEFVASTDREELLGEYLVASGRCMRMEIEMALALLPRYGGRLGDALVGLGVLRPLELFQAIAEQVRCRFLEAFRWRRGEWFFVPGVESHEETFPLGHDVYVLLRDACLEAPGDAVETFLRPHRDRLLRRVPAPPIPLAAFRPPDAWKTVLGDLTDRDTLGLVIARQTALGQARAEDIRRALHLGLSCGIVEAAA